MSMRKTLVYVADDEPAVLAMMRDVLERANYEVAAVPDGTALLAIVEQRKPDVILLDIAMPGLSGWEVQRRLREQPGTAGIPVVAVTAYGGPAVEGSALVTLGFVGFLRKPFPMARLLGAVEEALHGTKPPGAGPSPELAQVLEDLPRPEP